MKPFWSLRSKYPRTMNADNHIVHESDVNLLPIYHKMVRLLNNKMNVSRYTVYNWFVNGSDASNSEGKTARQGCCC